VVVDAVEAQKAEISKAVGVLIAAPIEGLVGELSKLMDSDDPITAAFAGSTVAASVSGLALLARWLATRKTPVTAALARTTPGADSSVQPVVGPKVSPKLSDLP
jgi:hypothetical protein